MLRTNRHTHTDADGRLTHATVVGVSKCTRQNSLSILPGITIILLGLFDIITSRYLTVRQMATPNENTLPLPAGVKTSFSPSLDVSATF